MAYEPVDVGHAILVEALLQPFAQQMPLIGHEQSFFEVHPCQQRAVRIGEDIHILLHPPCKGGEAAGGWQAFGKFPEQHLEQAVVGDGDFDIDQFEDMADGKIYRPSLFGPQILLDKVPAS